MKLCNFSFAMPPRKRKAEEIAVDSHNEESDNEGICVEEMFVSSLPQSPVEAPLYSAVYFTIPCWLNMMVTSGWTSFDATLVRTGYCSIIGYLNFSRG